MPRPMPLVDPVTSAVFPRNIRFSCELGYVRDISSALEQRLGAAAPRLLGRDIGASPGNFVFELDDVGFELRDRQRLEILLLPDAADPRGGFASPHLPPRFPCRR